MAFMFAATSVAVAQGKYKVGDRVECDAAQIGKFKQGTVVPYPKNDVDPSGRYYYVFIDGSYSPEGYVCMATHMRPLVEAASSNSQNNADNQAQDQSNKTTKTDSQSSAQPAQTTKLNKYGTRDPRTCTNTNAPARGAITAALAKQYLICQAEKVSGSELYLVENVTVEVGGGRPYNPQSDINYQEIDVKVPIYPIRGSYTQYQCIKEYPDPGTLYNVGKNCGVFEHRKATGSCYKTTFGDWRCNMFDYDMSSDDKHFGVAPPK